MVKPHYGDNKYFAEVAILNIFGLEFKPIIPNLPFKPVRKSLIRLSLLAKNEQPDITKTLSGYRG